jgi:hypothetical protein
MFCLRNISIDTLHKGVTDDDDDDDDTQTHSIHFQTFLYIPVPHPRSLNPRSTINDLPFHLSFLIPSRWPVDGCPTPTDVLSHRLKECL